MQLKCIFMIDAAGKQAYHNFSLEQINPFFFISQYILVLLIKIEQNIKSKCWDYRIEKPPQKSTNDNNAQMRQILTPIEEAIVLQKSSLIAKSAVKQSQAQIAYS